ncbi:MAG: hypothetical protein GX962_09025 [Epulopiscium sp.]|nr:hypothetical protein [Candidatus Epulonipiscium sp.]
MITQKTVNTYYIYPLSSAESPWTNIPVAHIKCFPWDTNGYMPKTIAQLAYTDQGLHVRLESYEKSIAAKYHDLNDPVHKDSCMEFFFNPNPSKDNRYLNFEINAIGTLHLGIGGERSTRRHMNEVDPKTFKIQPSVTVNTLEGYKGPSWVLQYFIPFSWLEEYYGPVSFQSGHKMMGNFYKCGDDTAFPHYGCWNLIETEKPDFHRPEYFGELIFA